MTEKVKVIIRERPPYDGHQSDVVIKHCDVVKNRIYVDDRPFNIGEVFDPESSQDDVYNSIKQLIGKFMEGYSCNVMAYGQSGTGKSYTMGLQADNFQKTDRGIVPRALDEIMKFAEDPNNETSVAMSFFEVYNEKVFDLLSDERDEPINNKGTKFTGGVKRPLKHLLDAELILIEGNKNRHTRPTTMNTNSSRSHGIVVIYRTTKNSSSTFHMVDLAGSEGVRRTGHKGEALTEGSHINRGLLGIGNIFKALSDGNGWVPYRDTVMGSVLQDSLNVNGFSTLVICISGLKKDLSETINSLSFAQKVMNWKKNPKIAPIGLQADSKKKTTLKKDESMSAVNQENFETPAAKKRPFVSSTAVVSRSKYRPIMNKVTEIPTPIALTQRPNNILDLENSRLMESPTVKQCFEAMKRTLQKRNYRINSINFSEVKVDDAPESDSGELDLTVIPNLQSEAEAIPVNNTSEYMTREECMRLVEAQFANLTKMKPEVDGSVTTTHMENKNVSGVLAVHELSDIDIKEDVPENVDASSISDPMENPDLLEDTIKPFEFKVPETTIFVPVSNDRRRSVRIQQRKSVAPVLSSLLPPPPAIQKRRPTTISKKAHRESTIGASVTKSDHSKNVLNLLNKGDMKDIQVLPQIGMKTAYCIITHRSLNGKFKSFKDVAKAPFWRGKGWERFEKANNLC